METPDLSRARWRTSSYSGSNSACVEVAVGAAARVLVRDTKNREGPVLASGPDARRRFGPKGEVRPVARVNAM